MRRKRKEPATAPMTIPAMSPELKLSSEMLMELVGESVAKVGAVVGELVGAAVGKPRSSQPQIGQVLAVAYRHGQMSSAAVASTCVMVGSTKVAVVTGCCLLPMLIAVFAVFNV